MAGTADNGQLMACMWISGGAIKVRIELSDLHFSATYSYTSQVQAAPQY
jgi:hypothetical protein